MASNSTGWAEERPRRVSRDTTEAHHNLIDNDDSRAKYKTHDTSPRDQGLRQQENEADPVSQQSQPKKAWGRVSLTGVAILVPGSLVMIGIIAFFFCVWRDAIGARSAVTGGDDSNVPWWLGALGTERATTTITLCTAAIRIVVASQASLVTAMIASVALERTGVRMIHAPIFSFTRAFNGGPTSLLPAMVHYNPRNLGATVALAAIILQALLLLGSQFLSTVLLLDLDSKRLNGPSYNESASVGAMQVTLDPWSSPIPAYTFAEKTGSFVTGPGYEDTGHTYRAFLPFQRESQRINLRHYRDNSFSGVPIYDSRVVCFRPSFEESQLLLVRNSDSNMMNGRKLLFRGQVTISNDTAGAVAELNGTSHVAFNCALPGRPSTSRRNSRSLCGLSGSTSVNSTMLRDSIAQNKTAEWSEDEKFYHGPLGLPLLLVVEMLEESSAWASMEEANLTISGTNDADAGETFWANLFGRSISGGRSPDNVTMRATACLTDLTSYSDRDLTMQREWEGNETTEILDPDFQAPANHSLTQRLGASQSPDSLEGRGLLNLETSWPNIAGGRYGQRDPFYSGYSRSLAESLERPSINLSELQVVKFEGRQEVLRPQPLPLDEALELGLDFDAEDTTKLVHLTHAQLYDSVLNQTGSVALGLQALFTRFNQRVFYDGLYSGVTRVGVDAGYTASFSVPVFAPYRWQGLVFAMTLVATQVILACAVTAWFLVVTRESEIGNSWQATAQLISEETIPLLEPANQATEGQVRKWVEGDKEATSVTGVLRRRNGRVVWHMSER